MKLSAMLACAAAAVAVSGFATAPAHAAAVEHCAQTADSVKVETAGTKTVATGLAPGTTVCYKAGTQLGSAVVDANGNITSTITNPNNARATLGVSYFVYTPEPCQTSSCG